MFSEHQAQFVKAIKSGFQDIALRRTNDNPFVCFYLPPQVVTIQLPIVSKEVIGKAFNVPNPFNVLNNRNFLAIGIAKLVGIFYDCNQFVFCIQNQGFYLIYLILLY